MDYMKHYPSENIEILLNMFFSVGKNVFGLIWAITWKTGLEVISNKFVRCEIHSDGCRNLYLKPKSTECCTLSP